RARAPLSRHVPSVGARQGRVRRPPLHRQGAGHVRARAARGRSAPAASGPPRWGPALGRSTALEWARLPRLPVPRRPGRGGARRLARYAAGVIPGVALLLVYDALAFGAPWHLSYRYIANGYVFAQNEAVFGVGLPKPYSSYEVFSGPGGLLVVSPVLVAGAWGL